MSTFEKNEMKHCMQILQSLQKSIETQEGYFLEFHWNQNEKAGYLEGNSTGLLHFICRLLDLCQKDFSGAHIHLDVHGDVPEGSDALIIFKNNLDKTQLIIF